MTAFDLHVLRGGQRAGARHPIDSDELVIGRDPGCPVLLPAMTVSRRHARVVRRPDGHYLEDLGSTFGTRLNGRPIDAARRLEDGDDIAVGECLLAYRSSGQPPRAAGGEPVVLGARESSATIEHGLVGVRAERKLAAFLDLARAVGGGQELGAVLSGVLGLLFEIFPGSERGLVVLDDGRGPRPVAARSREGGGGPAPRRTVSRTVYDQVARKGRAVLVQDVEADPRFSGSRSLDEARVRTVMAVPLRDHAKRVVGLLQLDTADPGARFDEGELDLLSAVAVQVGLVVDNARLMEEARGEQRRLRLLAAAGAALAASLDIDETLGALARLCVPDLADLCVVDILGEDGVARRVAAAHADPARQPLADRLLGHPPDAGGDHPAAQAMRSGRAAMAVDVAEVGEILPGLPPEHRDLVARLGVQSYLVLPLVARGRTLGALSLIGTRPATRHAGPDRALAEELARRAALAADNARLYGLAERARRHAEEASLAKDRLLATVSHELRTPLTPALLAVTGLLHDVPEASPLRGPLEAIRGGIELETRLIDDLLDATRAGAGKLRMEPRPVDAHPIVRAALDVCGEALGAAGLQLRVDLAARASVVMADPARLQQLVWNLVRNAAKFTPRGGHVSVTSRDDPGRAGEGARLVIEVADTGAGISPSALGRIFEPFEQGDEGGAGSPGGLGLGLAIARGIAEAHGGTLDARSEGRGRGATFAVGLPTVAAAPPPPPPPPPARGAPRGRATVAGAAAPRILLVEDDAATREVLARLLGLRGYEVATSPGVAHAIAAAGASRFDAVVSDLGLADGSGLEVASWLARNRPTPAIALSGYGSEEDVRRSLVAGFTLHMTKPVDFRRLTEALDSLVAVG